MQQIAAINKSPIFNIDYYMHQICHVDDLQKTNVHVVALHTNNYVNGLLKLIHKTKNE